MSTDTATPTLTGWKATLNKSATLFDRSGKARKQASALLWDGAQVAATEWLEDADTDTQAEGLYQAVLDVLGKDRKGDASKIKTVALAVKNHGLVLAQYPNLYKAYSEATRLTKTVKVQSDEDDAAEKAIEALAESAPKSSATPEGSAQILLSKGIDGAVVAILDALGANNFEAHRSFLRAMSQEISSRVQAAKPKPVKKAAAPKGAAKKATSNGQGTQNGAARATVKSGATKAKAAPAKKAAATKKATPVSRSKGDPNKRALPAKQSTPDGAPVPESDSDDLFNEFENAGQVTSPDSEQVEAPVGEARPDARPKGKPVVRR